MIDGFLLPNNWEVISDYIYSKNESIIDSEHQLGRGRARGNYRRSKLFKDNILVSETIEINPDYLPPDEIKRLTEKGEFIGEEFERTINFPNGYVAKIEYWNSKDEQKPNLGIYRSEYRKLILLNEKNQVISEVIQKNPNFGKTPYNKEELSYFRSKGLYVWSPPN